MLSNMLTAPILKLEKVMRNASGGDFQSDLEKLDIRTNDEIESLASSFKHMMVNLKERRIRLINEKNLLAALIDSSPDPTYFQDKEGNFLNCNSAFEKLVKTKKKKIIGVNNSSFLPDKVFESFIVNNRKAVETGKLSVNEISIDGEKIFETVTTPFYDSDGMIKGVIGVSRDISERVKTEKALRESEKRVRQIIENASDIIFSMDMDGRILEMSENWSRYMGYDISDIVGKDFYSFIYPDDRENVEKSLIEIAVKNEGISVDFRARSGNGLLKWYTCNSKLLRDEDNNPICIIGIARDITEKKKYFDKLQSEAELDPLTNVFNRRMLDYLLETEITKAENYKSVFTFIMIDLDFFKNVNDTYGHDKGDEVLKSCAEIFKNNTRQSDIIARYGGEEFVIIAPDTNPENGKMLAEKIRAVVEIYDFGLKDNLTASFGVSSYMDNDTPELLMKRADKALYSAKQEGRNRVETG